MRIDSFGNPEDDGWTEAFDAHVPRVDLVGSAANGSPRFLLMKSGQGGLMAPVEIRDLLKATPKSTPKTGSTMSVPNVFKYTRGGHVVSSVRKLTATQLATAIIKAKAKGSPQVAVFDAAGTLVGTVDADAINTIAAAPDAGKAPAPAPADPAAVAADQGAEQVAKAIQGATFRTDSSLLAKSAGTVDERFDNLVKSVDVLHSERLRNAVAVSALRFMAGSATSSAQAVRMAKMLSLDLAAAEVRRLRAL